jgi:hypothetical protein
VFVSCVGLPVSIGGFAHWTACLHPVVCTELQDVVTPRSLLVVTGKTACLSKAFQKLSKWNLHKQPRKQGVPSAIVA